MCDGEEVHRGSHLWTVSALELHLVVGEHQQVAPDKLDHREHRCDPILRERTTVFLNKIPKFFLIRKIFLTCSAQTPKTFDVAHLWPDRMHSPEVCNT